MTTGQSTFESYLIDREPYTRVTLVTDVEIHHFVALGYLLHATKCKLLGFIVNHEVEFDFPLSILPALIKQMYLIETMREEPESAALRYWEDLWTEYVEDTKGGLFD